MSVSCIFNLVFNLLFSSRNSYAFCFSFIDSSNSYSWSNYVNIAYEGAIGFLGTEWLCTMRFFGGL